MIAGSLRTTENATQQDSVSRKQTLFWVSDKAACRGSQPGDRARCSVSAVSGQQAQQRLPSGAQRGTSAAIRKLRPRGAFRPVTGQAWLHATRRCSIPSLPFPVATGSGRATLARLSVKLRVPEQKEDSSCLALPTRSQSQAAPKANDLEKPIQSPLQAHPAHWGPLGGLCICTWTLAETLEERNPASQSRGGWVTPG